MTEQKKYIVKINIRQAIGWTFKNWHLVTLFGGGIVSMVIFSLKVIADEKEFPKVRRMAIHADSLVAKHIAEDSINWNFMQEEIDTLQNHSK